jgi:hypothetical protein
MPEVAEFAVTEFAASLGRSTESGRRYLSQAVEGHYRLTRCWARLVAGELEAWRLGFIAERTLCLSPAAATFVDRHVAAVAHRIGPAQLARLIAEATARFDPDRAEAERLAAAEARHFDIDLAQVAVAGTVPSTARSTSPTPSTSRQSSPPVPNSSASSAPPSRSTYAAR